MRSLGTEEFDALGIRAARSGHEQGADDLGLAFSVLIQGFVTGRKKLDDSEVEFLRSAARTLGAETDISDDEIQRVQDIISGSFSTHTAEALIESATISELRHAHRNWAVVIRTVTRLFPDALAARGLCSGLGTFPLLFFLMAARSKVSVQVDATVSVLVSATEKTLDAGVTGLIESAAEPPIPKVWAGISATDFLESLKGNS